MKLNYKYLHLLAGSIILGSFTMLQAQLYVGNGGKIYISQGDSIYINEDLEIANGAMVTNNSVFGITLTGIATLFGTMEYIASGNQYILPYNHQTLHISGSGNKLLTSNISINTNLQLGGTAKLVTGNNIISLTGNGASITGVPAFGSIANSWIVTGNGSSGASNTGLGGLKIVSIGSTGRSGTIYFPVGPATNSYNPVTIINTGADDDFTVTVNDQPVPGAPAAETVSATWNITEASPGGSNVTLGTQWNAGDEVLNFIRAICGLVHSDGTAINYFASPGPASGAGPYTQTGSGFTSLSLFGVTSNATILPVNFLGIKGYQKGASIQVDWEVGAETAIKYYEIQKSATGSNFKVAGKLPAAGNTNNRQSYNWPDFDPRAGLNFYRIRSVGSGGSYKYSAIVKVNYAPAASAIRIYPNPVIDSKLVLEFNNKITGNYFVRIITTSGALVKEEKIAHNGIAGSYSIALPATLARGIYQVIISEPGADNNTMLKMMIHGR